MSGGDSGREEEIGTLIVVVLKAQNLNDKHFFKQDVYAQVSFGGTTKKTKIDYKGGQHPVWDAELRFPVMKSTTNKFRELEVSCYAKEHRDDTLLGEAKVDMSTTLKSGEFDGMCCLLNGPAPPQFSLLAPPNPNPTSTNLLQRRPSKMSPADRLYRPTSSVDLRASAQAQQQQQKIQNQGPRTPPKNNDTLPMPGSYPPSAHVKPGPGAVAVPNGLIPGGPRIGTVPNTLKPGPGPAPSTYTTGPTRVSPKQQQSQLPQLPQVPTNTSPTSSGFGFASNSQNASASVPIPSILRPGNPQSDPTHRGSAHTHRQSSVSPPRLNPQQQQAQVGYTPAPIPYTSSTPTPTPSGISGIPQNTNADYSYNRNSSLPFPSNPSNPIPNVSIHHDQPYTHRQSSNPSILNWNSDSNPNEGGSVSLSFPVPNFPSGGIATGAPAEPPAGGSFGTSASTSSAGYYTQTHTQPYHQPGPSTSSNSTYPAHQRTASFSHIQQPPFQHQQQHQSHHEQPPERTSSGDLPDPYLIARYQTPLPLPPESPHTQHTQHTHHRRTVSAEPGTSTSTSTYKPVPPLPAYPSSSSPYSQTPHASGSTSPRPLPAKLPVPMQDPLPRSRTPVDSSRLEALRRAEEEAARRKEQEERDAELARMLDLEEAERDKRERVERERERQLEREREREREKTTQKPSNSKAAMVMPVPNSRSRAKSPSPPPYMRAEANVNAETEAERRRKAQEEKDAELARQLDRELNLG
ncbi:hypothetical protein F5878DRAFT_664279 [Lentinula raphanica]|uniref:C2 domain-containing protein n=1 Tax=Lentinula raphanica TaxID=153919 RepID=A0AA38U9K6_9AGAR|nr:hypothetical protein F5878DRAFT_664279 [Lentinula raphanica]